MATPLVRVSLFGPQLAHQIIDEILLYDLLHSKIMENQLKNSRLPLRLGIPNSPHLFDEQGSFNGLAANALLKTFYFVFRSFNVSIISYNTEDMQCDQSGCSKMNNILEHGIDFDVGLFYLPSLPANMTQGPVRTQYLCYLNTRPPLQTTTSSHKLTDSFDQADGITWAFIILFWSLLVAISLVLVDMGPVKTAWYLIGAFLRNFSRIWTEKSARSILSITIVSFFMIQTIFFSFIRIGMVKNTQFEKIETMADVERHNMTILAFDYLPCHQIIRWSYDKQPIQPIPVTLIDIQGMAERIHKFDFTKVLIAGHGEYEMIYEVICLFTTVQRAFNYRSIAPAFRVPGSTFLSMATPKLIREQLKKYTYRTFETGNANKVAIQSPDVVRDLAGRGASKQCLAELTTPKVEEMTYSPLKLMFYLEAVYFLLVMIVLSGSILILEILFHKYFENR